MLKLYLLRHGKAAWPADVADRDRPLATRGERAVPLIGRYMVDHGFKPELIICSTARRTRQTAALIVRELKHEYWLKTHDALYEYDIQAYLTTLAEVAAGYSSAMLIAHNPVTEQLAALLSRNQTKQYTAPRGNYPTGALAVFNINSEDWNTDITRCDAELVDFVLPRQLADSNPVSANGG